MKRIVCKIGLIATMTVWQAAPALSLPDRDLSRDEMELRVWTESEYNLQDLEAEVVRRIQIDPYDAFNYYLLSHIALRRFTNSPQDLMLIKSASEMAQQSVDLSNRQDFGYVALASTLDVMGQSEKGLELLRTAATSGIAPSWRYYFSMARLQTDKSDHQKVLGLLEQALGFKKTQPEIIIPYIVAVLQTSVSESRLLTELFRWDAKFPNKLFKQTIAITLANLGKHKKAHNIYAAIHQQSGSYEAKINDGILLYRNLNQSEQAIRLFKEVLEDKLVAVRDPELFIVLQTHLAAAYLKKNHTEKARKHFIVATKTAKEPLEIIDFASKAYRSSKQAEHLSGLIQSLTYEIKPSGVLYAILGETQSEDLKNHEAALKSFSNAILLDPNRSDFYNGMGLTYYRMERHEEALSLFQEATKIDPNDATAMYNGACVLAKLGRVDESLGALKEALNLDPGLADHAKSDTDFKSLASNPQFNQIIASAGEEPPARRVITH